MAGLGNSNHVTPTNVDAFVPEIWSDEIAAAYKSNLVIANLVKKMNHIGKKGDTIHIPKPVRGSATAKAEHTQVNLIVGADTDFTVSIDKHFEYSRLIEDITDVQALPSLRSFYTEDAGYALARQMDSDLGALGNSLSGRYYMDSSTNLTAYAADTVTAADVFTDLGFRQAIQELDDADVPMDNRFMVVPPSVKKDILGIDRFNSSDFVNGRPVENGLLGDIYGIKIYVSTNLPEIESAAENSADGRIVGGILGHRDAFICAEQMGVRVQTQYKQEYLGDLMTADTIYGVAELRDGAAIQLAFASDATPSTAAP
jgi:N4-gp56 family major capsid protein